MRFFAPRPLLSSINSLSHACVSSFEGINGQRCIAPVSIAGLEFLGISLVAETDAEQISIRNGCSIIGAAAGQIMLDLHGTRLHPAHTVGAQTALLREKTALDDILYHGGHIVVMLQALPLCLDQRFRLMALLASC